MKKRIFVTGAAGFIGYHLMKALKKNDIDAIGYDNFNSYYDVQLKKDRINQIQGIKVIKGDLCNNKLLEESILSYRPTHIVNLAAQAGVRYSIDHPREYFLSNMEGFFNILEICRKNPNIHLVYASSSSVYGKNKTLPFCESDPINTIASFYGVTKASNEQMAAIYHQLYGISATALRFFTVYGPWGRPDMAYFSFTKKILTNSPIQVFNEGKMLRDFTYIDDIIAGILATFNLEKNCEIFNLGNHQPIDLNYFIEVIEESLGKKAIRQSLPMQLGDVPATYANIEKSQKQLKFFPKTPIEKGIPLFLDWYKKYFKI